ncbi:hypothetical protein VHUM_02094 [Vanrija humicola]|uniref:Fumarate reductase n=1 Tax=Vanrija humicola TaxID=5417 RepID=A0A7D8V0X6_VANHU|nr:hypothetical protein VHUM_02094 [Vanrija humicola]
MSTPPPTVIVVGSGLAGLSAAYTAVRAGARVHLLERAGKAGGNSIKASSGINGAGTRFQLAKGIDDTSFYADTQRSAGVRFAAPGVDRAALVSKLTTESAAAVTWLADEIGVDLGVVAPLGGHSVARTHRGGGKIPPGFAIIKGLLDKLEAEPAFTLTKGADVTALETRNGAVTGVAYATDNGTHALTGAVVFAAGGFAGDAPLLAEYRPDLAGLPSTNDVRPGAHGLLMSLGARLVDMDSVQVHPTGFVDPKDPGARLKFLAAEMLRGEGGILLDQDGKRFVNELDTRAAVTKAIFGLPSRDVGETRQWGVTLLLDAGSAEAAAHHVAFYEWKGLLKKVKLRDLSPSFIASVDAYSAARGSPDVFGRRTPGNWRHAAGDHDAEVYVGSLTPVTHFTMGGVAIDTDARVLTTKGDVVEGLWAAGEITGGVHGDNRLGGSSLLECVVFGRTAGAEAAKAAGAALPTAGVASL